MTDEHTPGAPEPEIPGDRIAPEPGPELEPGPEVVPAPGAPTEPLDTFDAPDEALPPVPPAREAAGAAGAAPPSPARSRTGLIALLVVGGLILAGVIIFGGGWWLLYGRPTKASRGSDVAVTISQGSNVSAIAAKLEKAGVVPSALGFELYVRAIGAGDDFQSGRYHFEAGASNGTIVTALQTGYSPQISEVAIPEGYSVRQIAARLDKRAGVDAEEFKTLALTQGKSFQADHPFLKSNHTDSLEGYLFPKTYLIKKGMTPRAIIDMMLTQFGEETADLDLAYARSRNLTLNDVATIASIIEKETLAKSDQAMVASVLYNRLRSGMRLGLDTTIIYALGLDNKERVYFKDLKVDSPYNTYKHFGLPPGPICNPGLPALKAAASPADTKYVYFIADKDGKLWYATSGAEFNKLKARLSQ